MAYLSDGTTSKKTGLNFFSQGKSKVDVDNENVYKLVINPIKGLVEKLQNMSVIKNDDSYEEATRFLLEFQTKIIQKIENPLNSDLASEVEKSKSSFKFP